MSRWLCSASQRAFALIRRAVSPLILRYRDAAERREKGRLCFIEGKDISFISNNRNFKQEKVDISRNHIITHKKQVDFIAKTLLFCILLPTFFEKVATQTDHHFARTNVRPNGHAPAHRALNEFVFSTFTLHLHTKLTVTLWIAREGNDQFNTSQVKENGVKPSPLTLYTSTLCRE